VSAIAAAIARTPLESWIARRLAVSEPSLTRESIARHQLKALQETVAWARNHSSFYAQRISALPAGLPASLREVSRLPFTSPEDLARHTTGFLCVPQHEIGRIVTLNSSGTSGGKEGDNLALKGMMSPGDHIVVSAIEHSAILSTCAWLEHLGCEVTRVGANGDASTYRISRGRCGEVTRVGANGDGQVEPDSVRRALRKNTRLISIMMANNETGVLQPVEEIGKIASEADVWFHTDAVQAAGKVPISVKSIGCDLLTISAHKIHGPQGAGALFVRRGTPLRPQLHGGRQKKGRRPGTENVAGIVGLGRASEIALGGLSDGSVLWMQALRDRLEAAILSLVPQTRINGKNAPRVPNTANVLFERVGGDALVMALDELGIAASRGAACTAGDADPSSVLMAMGLTGEQSRSGLRFSLGKMNTADDVERLISVLPGAVQHLREASQFFSTAPEAANG
jgi:cysteine desulfurase